MNKALNNKSIPNKESANALFLKESGEISLSDILNFLKAAYKTVAFFGLLGVSGSIVYIVATPNLYEATAQIRIAQLSQINPANPFGTPIEEPASLISRMQIPTNYSKEVLSGCGLEDSPQAALRLSKAIQFSIPKGVANAVELRVLSPSKEAAYNCANGIFSQMELLQEQAARPFIEEAKIKLAADNERIQEAKNLISRSDRSGSAMSAGYLSARDELTYFLTDREKMMDLINSVKNRGTKLISPIYVPETPIYPKVAFSLLVGLLGGILVGMALELVRQMLERLTRRSNHS